MRPFGLGNSWTYFIGDGHCGEISEIYVLIAKHSGLNAVSIIDSAEDHEWNEVILDNNWLHIDASANMFNKAENYVDSNWKKIPFVYWLDKNNQKINVTAHYTKTGTLSISTFDSNKILPYAHIQIDVNLGGEQKYVTDGYADENGQYLISLGAGNYEISAAQDIFILPIKKLSKKEVQIFVDTNQNLSLDLSDGQIYISDWATFAGTIILLLVIFVFTYRTTTKVMERWKYGKK